MAAIGLLLAAWVAPAAYAGAGDDWFRDALRVANPENSWPDRSVERALYWDRVLATSRAYDYAVSVSPFVNTYRGRVTLRADLREPVRACACYLPENLRSFNGGPLGEREIISLCMRQCF
jgi:hypothetical protein